MRASGELPGASTHRRWGGGLALWSAHGKPPTFLET